MPENNDFLDADEELEERLLEDMGEGPWDYLDEDDSPSFQRFEKSEPVNEHHDFQRRTENAVNRHRKNGAKASRREARKAKGKG